MSQIEATIIATFCLFFCVFSFVLGINVMAKANIHLDAYFFVGILLFVISFLLYYVAHRVVWGVSFRIKIEKIKHKEIE